MLIFKAIVLFGVVVTSSLAQFSGGYVGSRLASSGGFIGNSGLLNGGGYVGHQNIPLVQSGGFVGHDSIGVRSYPIDQTYYSHPYSIDSSINQIPSSYNYHGLSHIPSIYGSPYQSYGTIGRYRRSIDGIRTHDKSPTVYYGIDQPYNQAPRPVINKPVVSPSSSSFTSSYTSSSSSYDQSNKYSTTKNEDDIPHPYQFSLQTQDDGNGTATWTQQEESTGDGVITGSYTIQDPLTGTIRIVNYRADDDGFHADIQSNEPGMVDSQPANVLIRKIQSGYSSAPTVNAQPKQYAKPKAYY